MGKRKKDKGKKKRPGSTPQKAKGSNNERRLLVTLTNEPFMPVRLYYAIPDRSFVVKKLKKLECMAEVPVEQCWQWLFHGEASSLRFVGDYDEVPEERRPIVIGRIRFPQSGGMTLETNSIPRAIEGARFFRPRFGSNVVATRCRVVNRCFAGDEGVPGELLKTLEQDVTVIDPRVAEEEFRREVAGARSWEDRRRAVAASLERKLKSKNDVPLVEDFPLAPEEETPEFQHLATTLQFRLVRAMEHWCGNTHLTLAAIIVRMVEESARGPDLHS